MTSSPQPPVRRAATALVAVVSSLAVLLALVVATATTASAYPPEPPSPSVSAQHLATLDVEAVSSGAGYDRDDFRHWTTVSGRCDTRETVLGRDGTDVVTDADCGATAGRWYSVYDGVYVTDSSAVDIDHVVPLSEAYKSGADAWTDAERETFANDLAHAQLIAVSASSNRSKGDQDPAEWKPTNTGVWCNYARDWIDVKYVYDLAVDTAEVAALDDMLATC